MYVTSPATTLKSEIHFPLEAVDNKASRQYQELTIKEGENLFFTGDEAEFVYEVIEGVVRSSKVLMDGRRQVLNFCYPGEILGLSHDGKYHCDCEAVSPVKVRLYRKNAFFKEIDADPEFCARLLRSAAAEVNNMQDHFMMLGRKSAMEKIASFLVALLDRVKRPGQKVYEFDLPMNRSDVADFLGVTIETVSRNLTRLRQMGVIELPNTHQVIVCRPAELRELAENTV